METSSRNTTWHLSIPHKCHWMSWWIHCLIIHWFPNRDMLIQRQVLQLHQLDMIRNKDLLFFSKNFSMLWYFESFSTAIQPMYIFSWSADSSLSDLLNPGMLVQCSVNMHGINFLFSCSFAAVKFLDRKAWSTTFTALCCNHDTMCTSIRCAILLCLMFRTPMLTLLLQVILSLIIWLPSPWMKPAVERLQLSSTVVQPSWSQQYLFISIIWYNLLAACFPMSSQSASILSAMSFRYPNVKYL